jgi:hypothetical protein
MQALATHHGAWPWQEGVVSLYIAAQNNHEAVVRLLLEHKAEVDAKKKVPECVECSTK